MSTKNDMNQTKDQEEFIFQDDDMDFEEFYSFPFETKDNYIYQYKIIISNDMLSLYQVKNYDDINDDINDEINDEINDNFFEEEIIKHYIDISLPNALIKMNNNIDLRYQNFTKITNKDLQSQTLLELYCELI